MTSAKGLVLAITLLALLSATAAAADCGDGTCGYGENCENCPADCPTSAGDCCNPSLYPLNKGRAENGLQWSESGTYVTYICCSGTAYQGSCCDNSGCGSGYACSGHRCTQEAVRRANGESCSSDSGCDSSNCIHGICCTSPETCCSSDSDCSSGYECGDDHYCVSAGGTTCGQALCQLPDGGYCSKDSECASGNCNYLGSKGPGLCCAYGEKCCDYKYHAGETMTVSGVDYECTSDYTLVEKTGCGDGTCSAGENCNTCPSDCGCSSGECCVVGREVYHTDDSRGCAASGELIFGLIDGERSFCCEGNIIVEGTDACCFDSHCKEGEECRHEFGGEAKLSYCVKKVPPSPGGTGQAGGAAGTGQTGGTTGTGTTQTGATQQPAAKSLLDSFYANYETSAVLSLADGKYVPRSALYRGVSSFYRDQADYIDMPVATLGKFTLIMDNLNDLARSVVSVNPISFAIELNDFINELSEKIPEPGPLQNLALNAYSIGSMASSISEQTGWGQEALAKLTARLPSNRVLESISKRQAALQAKLLPNQATKTQFFLLDMADFVMDQTLLSYVRQEFDYAMVDYSQKIELSIMARELASLYQKAEDRTLTEREAIILMETEYNFWNMVLAKEQNLINNERSKSLIARAWNKIIERIMLANYEDTISSSQAIMHVAEDNLNMVKQDIDGVFET